MENLTVIDFIYGVVMEWIDGSFVTSRKLLRYRLNFVDKSTVFIETHGLFYNTADCVSGRHRILAMNLYTPEKAIASCSI